MQAFQWPALRNTFTVDAVVTVVDAPAVAAGRFAEDPVAVDAQRRADENLDHDSPLAELFEDQLATADLVVLHKTDGMDAAAIAQVEAIVRAETPAGVKLVHAQHGRIDPDVLLGHAIFLDHHSLVQWWTKKDLDILAATGTSVAHCPVVFSRYGQMMEDVGSYIRKGVNVADEHARADLDHITMEIGSVRSDSEGGFGK